MSVMQEYFNMPIPVGYMLAGQAVSTIAGAMSAAAARKQQQQQFAYQQAQAQIDRAMQMTELARQKRMQTAGTVNATGDRTYTDPITGQTISTEGPDSNAPLQRSMQRQALQAGQRNLEGNEAFKVNDIARLLEQQANKVRFRDASSRQESTLAAGANIESDQNKQLAAQVHDRNLQSLRGGDTNQLAENMGGPGHSMQADQIGRQLAQQNETAKQQGINALMQLQQARFAEPGQVPNINPVDQSAAQAQGTNAYQNQNINSLMRFAPPPEANILPDDSFARGLSGMANSINQNNQQDMMMALLQKQSGLAGSMSPSFFQNAMGNSNASGRFMQQDPWGK